MTEAELNRNLGSIDRFVADQSARKVGAKNRPKAKKPKPTKPKPKPVYIGGARELGARPAAPKQIDPKAITTTAIQQGNRLSDAQEREYKQLYGTLAGQQRGEIDRIAAGLNNQYTQQAMGALGTSMDSAGTMERMANEELALGRSLSPEAMREATQSARGAFAARGLGTSLGSAAAELLNRDRYASQREQQRRTFAGTLMDTAGQMRQRGAALYGELDPYQRALTPGLSLGQTAQQFGLNTTGNNFGNTLQLGANAASFNTNMAGDLFTNWQNNAAAIKGANTTAQATRDASKKGFWDYTVEGFKALSDKREKKDIKPLGNTGSILGLPAYKFKYKGEDKEHVGFMAQDVQKVLPEAVAEVDYQGKKRLAIKPAVIGAALANELMTAKAA